MLVEKVTGSFPHLRHLYSFAGKNTSALIFSKVGLSLEHHLWRLDWRVDTDSMSKGNKKLLETYFDFYNCEAAAVWLSR